MSPAIGEHLAVAGPFLFALLLCAVTPELTSLARRTLLNRIAPTYREQGAETQSALPPVPHPYLSREYIGDYLEYAGDTAQAVPLVALPIVGTLFSLQQGLNAVIAMLLLSVSVVLMMWRIARLLQVDPIRYIERKIWLKYTTLTFVSGGLNLVGFILVMVLLPVDGCS